jgi:hypothetical protein
MGPRISVLGSKSGHLYIAHQPAQELLRERVVHDQGLILSHSPEAFPLPQTLYFGFKHSDAPVAFGKGGFDIGGPKTLRGCVASNSNPKRAP